ncbi:uncharacterized protein LOC125501012 [Athalia rosae]|uniref:uncharacterized protein LOC125501012 n=1 Tax=Athalia rosae TaxID=37344 RepID=UPI002033C74B|nr:uncharacterized protein LOC125501012 [Athalia rosae]
MKLLKIQMMQDPYRSPSKHCSCENQKTFFVNNKHRNMSFQLQLDPELQKLIEDFTSVRQRFSDLASSFAQQQALLASQQEELKNANQLVSSLKHTENENYRLKKSYEQLKRDYELLYSSSGKHRDEVHAENKKHVKELEEELKLARAKYSAQAESHQRSVAQIIADYEAKLRDANDKIRQHSMSKGIRDTGTPKTAGHEENIIPIFQNISSQAPSNNKWPKLQVKITPRGGSTRRGRGRGRGTASKRKLYTVNDDNDVDMI